MATKYMWLDQTWQKVGASREHKIQVKDTSIAQRRLNTEASELGKSPQRVGTNVTGACPLVMKSSDATGISPFDEMPFLGG